MNLPRRSQQGLALRRQATAFRPDLKVRNFINNIEILALEKHTMFTAYVSGDSI